MSSGPTISTSGCSCVGALGLPPCCLLVAGVGVLLVVVGLGLGGGCGCVSTSLILLGAGCGGCGCCGPGGLVGVDGS